MALVVNNTFEGTAAGTNIVTGGASSGGTPVTLVAVTGTATVKHSATGPAHGLVGCQCIAAGGTDTYRVRWDFTTNASGVCSFRFYFTLQSLPSQAQDIAFLYSASGSACKVGLLIGNTLRLTNLTGALVGTASPTLSATTTYRVEVQAKKGTGTTDGQLAMQVYVGDSGTLFHSASSTTTDAGTTDFSQVHFGEGSGSVRTINITFDDLALDNTTQTPLGPVRSAARAIAVQRVAVIRGATY